MPDISRRDVVFHTFNAEDNIPQNEAVKEVLAPPVRLRALLSQDLGTVLSRGNYPTEVFLYVSAAGPFLPRSFLWFPPEVFLYVGAKGPFLPRSFLWFPPEVFLYVGAGVLFLPRSFCM